MPTDTLTPEQALERALAHYQAGEHQQALQYYQAVLQADPNHATANHNVGAIALKLNRSGEALRHFNAALRADPDTDQHWVSLVQTLAVTGQRDMAATMLEQAEEHGVSAEALERMRPVVHPRHHIKQQKDTTKIDPDELVLPAASSGASAPKQEYRKLQQLLDKQQYDACEQQAKTLLAKHGGDGHVYLLLGRSQFHNGKSEEARKSFETAVALVPDNAIAVQNLAVAYNALALPDRAVAAYKKALTLQPDNTDLLLPYANALKACFRMDEAITIYWRMIDAGIKTGEAWNNTGLAYRVQHRYEEARKAFHKSIAAAPEQTWAYQNLGAMQSDLGEHEQALHNLGEALARAPDDLPTLMSLAQIHHRQGSPDEAARLLRQALTKRPTHSDALNRLYDMTPFGADSEDFRQLTAITQSEEATEQERIIAYFSMGGIHLDEGNDKAAFEAYRSGNELVKAERRANLIIHRQAKNIANSMDKRFFNTRLPMGSTSKQPVLISGMPRSGKSLLEKLLAQSPEVAAARELDGMQDLLPGRGDGKYLLNHIQSITRKELNQRIETLLRALRGATGTESEYITETTPKTGPLPYYTVMFPHTPVIFCDRNPWDLMATCYFKYFRNGHNNTFDIAGLAEQIKAEKLLMARWLEVLPNPVMKVTYEEMVADPAATGRRMAEFLGIEWDDEYARNVTADGDSRGEVPDANPINSIDYTAAPVPLSTKFIGFGERFREFFLPYLSSEDPFSELE